MQTVTLRHREVSAVEPATPMSSARPDYQAGSLEVLLRADSRSRRRRIYLPDNQHTSRASVRDRIDRAKGMTVSQAVRLKFYTTRSLKRDETAGYIRLVRATGEVDPDTFMRDAEGDGLESDRSPMDSDTDVRNPVDDFSD